MEARRRAQFSMAAPRQRWQIPTDLLAGVLRGGEKRERRPATSGDRPGRSGSGGQWPAAELTDGVACRRGSRRRRILAARMEARKKMDGIFSAFGSAGPTHVRVDHNTPRAWQDPEDLISNRPGEHQLFPLFN